MKDGKIAILRTRITGESASMESSPNPKKSRTDYTTPERRAALVRAAIMRATEVFAEQDVYTKQRKIAPDDAAIIEAMMQYADDERSFDRTKKLVEALTGRRWDVERNAPSVRYNFLAAFVPLSANNGHTYYVDKVAVSIVKGVTNGTNSFKMSGDTGNTPPSKPSEVRPATMDEIEAIEDKYLLAIEGLTGVTFIPVEVPEVL